VVAAPRLRYQVAATNQVPHGGAVALVGAQTSRVASEELASSLWPRVVWGITPIFMSEGPLLAPVSVECPQAMAARRALKQLDRVPQM
jgi:hypothetical protein